MRALRAAPAARRAGPAAPGPLLLVAALLALTALLLPAPGAADSVFSTGGLGEPQDPEPARIRALGGSGAAEHGERAFSVVNPASMADVERLLIEGTIQPAWRWIDATSYPDETAHETTFPSIRGVIALPGRIVLGGAYVAGTSGQFHVDRAESLGAVSSLHIDGTGGMNFARISLARRLTPALSVGIDYDVVSGSYREEWARTFTDSTLAASRDTLEATYEKRGRWRLGAQGAWRGAVLGAVLELPRSLPLTQTQRTDGASDTSSVGELKLPAGFTLGASVPVGERYRAVAQYQRSAYDRSTVASTLVDFRTQQRFSVGVERHRVTEEGPAGLLDRLPIRVGAYLLNWPDLLPLAGASDISAGTAHVNEWAVTLGTGIRSKDAGGSVDIALEAGSRGSLDGLGARERFVRFAISLQVSDETWKGSFH